MLDHRSVDVHLNLNVFEESPTVVMHREFGRRLGDRDQVPSYFLEGTAHVLEPIVNLCTELLFAPVLPDVSFPFRASQ